MNAKLLKHFFKEEVKTALKQIAPLKSPRPDGYGVVFYQQHWETVDVDVCEAVLSILNGEGLSFPLNETFIAFIFKKNNANCVNDF